MLNNIMSYMMSRYPKQEEIISLIPNNCAGVFNLDDDMIHRAETDKRGSNELVIQIDTDYAFKSQVFNSAIDYNTFLG